MRMRIVTFVTSLFVVAALVVSVGATRVKCSDGDCTYIAQSSGIGYNYNCWNDTSGNCASEVEGRTKAYQSLQGQCGDCSQCEGGSDGHIGGTVSNGGALYGNPYGHVEPNPNGDGSAIVTITLSALCVCSTKEAQEMSVAPNTRVQLTTSQKILQFLFGKPKPAPKAPGKS